MPLKKGDKVIVLSGRGESNYAGGWVDSMDKLVGKELTLKNKETEYGWRTVEEIWTFDERFLKKVEGELIIDENDFDKRLNEFYI